MTPEAQAQVWTLLAAVLLLGNICFSGCDEMGESCQPYEPGGAGAVAKLLDVPTSSLSLALTRRRLSVRNQNTILRTQSSQQVMHRVVSIAQKCEV